MVAYILIFGLNSWAPGKYCYSFKCQIFLCVLGIDILNISNGSATRWMQQNRMNGMSA